MDELYLVSLLKQILLINPNFKDTFLYKLIKQQLLCLLPKDGEKFASGLLIKFMILKGRRKWDKDIIHWCLTLQYHGGKGIIDILRGKGFQDQGKSIQQGGRCGQLIIDPNNWGLILPANSTLKHYIPSIQPYQKITPQKCQLLAKILGKSVIFSDIMFIY
jgi:hypothetical protein